MTPTFVKLRKLICTPDRNIIQMKITIYTLPSEITGSHVVSAIIELNTLIVCCITRDKTQRMQLV